TRYQVAVSVWQAMKKPVSDPRGKSGQFQQGKSGQFHGDININANINKNNMTACGQPNVLRETCEDNEQKSDVILKNEEILPTTTLPLGKRLRKEEGLPLETNLLQTPTLNARQRRYVQGMLAQLTADHGCRFSDPSGLFHAICLALQQIPITFPGRHSFPHRLNPIGNL
ncbi:MAG: hypothetical protein GY821_09970, partial [Gammaproteobacteria bacterium]|nr:hypothetical protein [Gammaproteobacteria bacterium]